METEVKKHESFGMVGLSRVSCNPPDNLFGSSIKHGTYIELSIKRAEYHRDLSRDWFFARDEIVSVKLGPSQFCDLITNMNVGEGVPCTLNYVMREKMQDVPIEDKRVQFRNEFDKDMEGIASRLDRAVAKLEELKKSKTIKKGDIESLRDMVLMARQDIKSNVPFVNNSFAEQMDKTVTEAKAEVEAFATHMVMRTGIAALKGETPQFQEGHEIKKLEKENEENE
jgi:hypothetical protein